MMKRKNDVDLRVLTSLGLWAALMLNACVIQANEEPGNLGALETIPWENLSDRSISTMGQKALSIREGEWHHAETENFVYHYFTSFIATPVSVEAEFYYRFIAADLNKTTEDWERKCHIFIFDRREDWQQFQQQANLDPWTGGIHSRNELYILRNREDRWKGHLLGHEVAHLVIDRFYGSNVPLWVNEGYAEYASRRAYASFFRARGYRARPRSPAVSPDHFIPLPELTRMVNYPRDVHKIRAFYNQSERLVRFLSRDSKQRFAQLLENLSRGNQFETALNRAYGARFGTMTSLEREFKEYATAEFGTTMQQR